MTTATATPTATAGQPREPLNLHRLAEWWVGLSAMEKENSSSRSNNPEVDDEFAQCCQWIRRRQQQSAPPSTQSSWLVSHMTLRQFGHGQSNPTFLVTIDTQKNANDDSANNTNMNNTKSSFSFVLRKKPAKVAHVTAHALHREYRVLTQLQLHNQRQQSLPSPQNTNTTTNIIPIPKPHAYCQDTTVLGAEFYLMEYVRGTVFVDPSLPGLTAIERAQVYRAMMQTLTALHAVDYAAIGLQDYGGGKKDKKTKQQTPRKGFVERQLQRLSAVSRQQAKLLLQQQQQQQQQDQNQSQSDSSSSNDKNNHHAQLARQILGLAQQLQQSLPPRTVTTLIHGDFKLDNLVFQKVKTVGSQHGQDNNSPKLNYQYRVAAILDWELSTIGDPFCDLANVGMMYHMPHHNQASMAALRGLGGLDLRALGIPSRYELICMYCCSWKLSPTARIVNNNDNVALLTSNVNYALDWSGYYLAFLFFKNCVIVQGVAQRASAGVASSAFAKQVARLLPVLVEMTQSLLDDQQQQQQQAAMTSRL